MFRLAIISLIFEAFLNFQNAEASAPLIRQIFCSDLLETRLEIPVNTLSRPARIQQIRDSSGGFLSEDYVLNRLENFPDDLLGVLADLTLMDSVHWGLRPFQIMSIISSEAFLHDKNPAEFKKSLLKLRSKLFTGGDSIQKHLKGKFTFPLELPMVQPNSGRIKRVQILNLDFQSGLAIHRILSSDGVPLETFHIAPIDVLLGLVPHSALMDRLPTVWPEFSPHLHHPEDSAPRWSQHEEQHISNFSLYRVQTGKAIEALPSSIQATLFQLRLPVPQLKQSVPDTLPELTTLLQEAVDQGLSDAYGATPTAHPLITPEHFAFRGGDLRHIVLMAPFLKKLGFSIQRDGRGMTIPGTAYINRSLLELSGEDLIPNSSIRFESFSYPGRLPPLFRLRGFVEGRWYLANGTALQRAYRFQLLTPLMTPERIWNLIRAQAKALLTSAHVLNQAPPSTERDQLLNQIEQESTALLQKLDSALPHLFALGLQTGRFPEHEREQRPKTALLSSRFAQTLIQLGTQSPRDRLRNAIQTEDVETPALKELLLKHVHTIPDLSLTKEEVEALLSSELLRKQILNLL